MILTEQDIKKLVNECVARIMEARGALDNKLRDLAGLIVDRIKSGENNFTLTRDEIAPHYPYKHVPEYLNIVVKHLKEQEQPNILTLFRAGIFH